MFTPRSIQSSLTLKGKIYSIDYILALAVLLLGIISMFAMYSTDGGQILYHSKKPHNSIYNIFSLIFFYPIKLDFGTALAI